jgi:endonuclease-3 related protein
MAMSGGGRPGTYAIRRKTLMDYYAAMLECFSHNGWWPAGTPFEVAVGAILTQNTAWRNVEAALAALRSIADITPDALYALPGDTLEAAVRPAGFFRQKSRSIRALLAFLADNGGLGHGKDGASLSCLDGIADAALRSRLLAVTGIGPETADCILLYGLNRPFFVADAYTRRIFQRHGLIPEAIDYDGLREFFMDALPPDVVLYNEYHALIVRTGKEYCRKTHFRCGTCPLGRFLDYEPAA